LESKGTTKIVYSVLWGTGSQERHFAEGRQGLEEHVNKIMKNKDFLIDQLKKRRHEGFELVNPDFELTNICFRFIPEFMNPLLNPDLDRNSTGWQKRFNAVRCAITLKTREKNIL